MERVEASHVDCRLSGCQAVWKAWFSQFASSPERHSGVKCMKMKLNLPFRATFKVKCTSCNGDGKGMQNSGLCPEKSPKYKKLELGRQPSF